MRILFFFYFLSLSCQAFQLQRLSRKPWNSWKWTNLQAKKEIAPGIYEFTSQPGEIPAEIARLVTPDFIKQNNLRVSREVTPSSSPRPTKRTSFSSSTSSNLPDSKLFTKTGRLRGQHSSPKTRQLRKKEEDEDDVSIEDLERQLAYETGIGGGDDNDDDDEDADKERSSARNGNKKKAFEPLSDKILKDKTRFQGFGSSSSSSSADFVMKKPSSQLKTKPSNKNENDDDDDDEDDYDDDYDEPVKSKQNSNKIVNPLIMRDKKPTSFQQPLKPTVSLPQSNVYSTKKSPIKQTQQRSVLKPSPRQFDANTREDNEEDDEHFEEYSDAKYSSKRNYSVDKDVGDYDDEEAVFDEEPSQGKVSKPLGRLGSTTSTNKKTKTIKAKAEEEEDYDAILNHAKKRFENKYLFDLEDENKSLVDLKSIGEKKPSSPSRSSSSFSSNVKKPLSDLSSSSQSTNANPSFGKPLPPQQYKQLLNEEFYRMKKPNLTFIETKRQQRYDQQLQRSLQEFEKYQSQLKKQKEGEELNPSKFIPFSLTESIEEFQDSLSSPTKQLYVPANITFEDVLFNDDAIRAEYYSSESLLNQQRSVSGTKSSSVGISGNVPNRFKSKEFYELIQFINDNLETMKITTPTKIQEIAIPLLSIGKNTILHAQTGSGKTLTYLLPLIYLIDPNIDRVQSIILAPSRELVTQINRVCNEVFAGTNFRSVGLIGGANVKSQLKQLREIKPQIIVATPGRLAEIVFKYEKISLQGVNSMIIDEADNLLQDPFQNEIKTLIEATPFMKAKLLGNTVIDEVDSIDDESDGEEDKENENEQPRQTSSSSASWRKRKYVLCLASATANNNPVITSFMEQYSVKNVFYHPDNRETEPSKVPETDNSLTTTSNQQKPTHHFVQAVVDHAGMLPSTITHGIISCPRIKVYEMLKRFLNAKPEINRALIFVNDPYKVETVYEKLLSYGFIAAPLHGDSSKDDRKEIFTRLRDGRLRLVVTTELSARGLDIPDVTHVINFELPTDSLHYVHRVGRCGRAGKPGLAINFCTPETKFVIRRFVKQLGTKVYDCEIRGGQVYLKRI